jgi:mono/diheme cytochrome c family protein
MSTDPSVRVRRPLKCVLATASVLLVLGVIGGAAFSWSGIYDVSAVEQHTKPVYWIIEASMRRSVHAHSGGAAMPSEPPSNDALRRGLAVYHAECERCHGGPGVAPERFALGMTPTPANLADTADRWKTRDIYWVVKYGLKMTGMPSWMYRLSEEEMHEVSAFVSHGLRDLSPDEYRKRARASEIAESPRTGPGPETANAEEGKRVIQQHACATCHVIPGITGATKTVGPPLRGMAGRSYIAGVLPNSRENMIAWLQSPPKIKPGTAMPDLGLTEQDARHVAAYLESVR